MHSVEKRRNTDFIKAFVSYSNTSEHGLDINAVLEVLHSFDMEDIQIAKDHFSSSVSEKYDTEESKTKKHIRRCPPKDRSIKRRTPYQ